MEDSSLRILVVDGGHPSRGNLGALVRQSGHEAMEARSGGEAVANAWEFRPDIVIVEYGPEALRVVRDILAAGDSYQPYVALVAGAAERKLLPEPQAMGIDAFIDRPVKAASLVAHLRAARRIVALQRENESHKRKLQQYSQELICSNLRLRELAMTDELTGLPNRRYSLELMQQEWLAASQDSLPLSCMVIDLNGIKQINDQFGLERGDVVIKTVAAIMRRYLPTRDTVCRISGDEFLVICPGTALNSALACGDKLVGLIRSFNIQAQGSPLGLSIGVAERRPGVEGPQALINLAEQAMHRAKHAGRDRVESAHGADRRIGRSSREGSRRTRKDFSLWRQADGLGMAVA
ncbi:MAG TPA: diguanylate cyclase [Rhodocyclaceae bacterium]|nr:diguanylate cyclase [Rhodocyclaceae bacterium]